MDIKCKTCYILTWKRRLFLDSINTDALVPLLYQYVETRSIEVFASVAFSTRRSGRASSATNDLERIYQPSCEPCYATHTSHRKEDVSLWMSLVLSPFVHRKTHNRMLLFSSTRLKQGHRFEYWNQLLNMHLHVFYLDNHETGLCCAT
jgi:hypothetical protein